MQMDWLHRAARVRARERACLRMVAARARARLCMVVAARGWLCVVAARALARQCVGVRWRLRGLPDTQQVRREVTWRLHGLPAGRLCRDARARCAELRGPAESRELERNSSETTKQLDRTSLTIRTCRDLDSMPCMWRQRVGTAGTTGSMAAIVGMSSECCFHFLVEAGITCRPGRIWP